MLEPGQVVFVVHRGHFGSHDDVPTIMVRVVQRDDGATLTLRAAGFTSGQLISRRDNVHADIEAARAACVEAAKESRKRLRKRIAEMDAIIEGTAAVKAEANSNNIDRATRQRLEAEGILKARKVSKAK